VTRVVNQPEFRDKYIIARGLVPAINTPEEFAKEIKADRAGAEQVVKESGLPPQ
jgi:tripartite-type tricarboxylate transporter receptor subunit TctC